MHLEGELIKSLPGDKLTIHHDHEVRPQGPRGGVAIILLSSLLAEGWKKGGNHNQKV